MSKSNSMRDLAASMGMTVSDAADAEPWGANICRAYSEKHADRSHHGWSWLPDVQIASAVRMLAREHLDHEAVVCEARNRICALVVENAALRVELLRATDGRAG